jgi:hypothetical protein
LPPNTSYSKSNSLNLLTPSSTKVNAEFVQVYGAKIIAKKELTVVDDGESKVFVYKVDPFLVMQI